VPYNIIIREKLYHSAHQLGLADKEATMSNNEKPNPIVDQDTQPRPKSTHKAKTNFYVEDQVYLRVGSNWTGPYFIAQVVRPGVYILCDEHSNPVENGAEISERYLQGKNK